MILSLNKPEDLTQANLKKLDKLLFKENTILLNHATWCGHCQMFRPEWDTFKTRVGKKVNVVEIESSALESLRNTPRLYKKAVAKDGVVYFPMLMVFVENTGKASSKRMYEGNRDAASLEAYVTKNIKSSPKVKEQKKKSLQNGGKKGTPSNLIKPISMLSLSEINRHLDMLIENVKRK
jgi:thiol-disulfide isomerase/thioredoxin